MKAILFPFQQCCEDPKYPDSICETSEIRYNNLPKAIKKRVLYPGLLATNTNTFLL